MNLINTILTFFIITLVIYLFCKVFKNDEVDLKCIISTESGIKYCIRDNKGNTKESIKLLNNVGDKCFRLVNKLYNDYPGDEKVKRLKAKFVPEKIIETLPTSELTAYSENKGEKIAFCLNEDKERKNLIDEHTLTFVAIHELAHIMTISIGHKQEFWQNFKFLLEHAKNYGIHEPLDYKQHNKNYCGIHITDNPYYDL